MDPLAPLPKARRGGCGCNMWVLVLALGAATCVALGLNGARRSPPRVRTQEVLTVGDPAMR